MLAFFKITSGGLFLSQGLLTYSKKIMAVPELKLRRFAEIFKIISKEVIFEFFQIVWEYFKICLKIGKFLVRSDRRLRAVYKRLLRATGRSKRSELAHCHKKNYLNVAVPCEQSNNYKTMKKHPLMLDVLFKHTNMCCSQ
jgi:hypothetical protein